jgi:hypothetical protein
MLFVGPDKGSNKIKHVATKNLECVQKFIELKSDFENLKENINCEPPPAKLKTQIYCHSELREETVAPDFAKKIESAIVKEGS